MTPQQGIQSMRLRRRLSLALIGLTAGAVQAALAEVGATPAAGEAHGTPVETDLPASANDAASVTTPAGTLTMEVPAEGRDLNRSDNSTAVFEGTGEDTDIAVQATEVGRAGARPHRICRCA
jgi:hypothetical protein